MKKTFYDIIYLVKESALNFSKKDPFMMAGALAFFTVFAIPPIFIIIIYFIGLFTGYHVAEVKVFNQLKIIMGASQANVMHSIVTHYFAINQNVVQRILRICIFIFASSSYFIIIQHAINQIWQVKPVAKNNIIKILENRAVSFGVIILMGFILGLALVSHAVFLSLQSKVHHIFPGLTPILLSGLGAVMSLILGTLGFAVVFRFLPDVHIEWKVVWVGAIITSILFLIGNLLISFGLTSTNIKLMYGSAGSMALFLLWVFYSNIILFYGAEITRQYAHSFAKTIRPKPHAVRIVMKEIPREQSIT